MSIFGGGGGLFSGGATGVVAGLVGDALTGGGVSSVLTDVKRTITGETVGDPAERIAEEMLAQQRADRAQALEFAAPSPEELAALSNAINVTERDIARKERVLSSFDAATIAAGEQAAQLIQGQEAATLAPLRRDIEERRQRLRETLRQQLGPDFENSSAGIRALNDFEAEASGTLATAQQQAISNLQGLTVAGGQLSQLTPNIQNLGGLAQLRGGINQRGINAIAATPINMAGASQLGDLMQGRQMTNLFQGALNAGIGAVTSGAGGGPTSGASGISNIGRITPSTGPSPATSGGASGIANVMMP